MPIVVISRAAAISTTEAVEGVLRGGGATRLARLEAPEVIANIHALAQRPWQQAITSEMQTLLELLFKDRTAVATAWSLSTDALSRILKEVEDAGAVVGLSTPAAAAKGVLVLDDQDSRLYAAAMFWRTLLNPNLLESPNSDIFEYDILPTLLAREGNGIFYDERLEDRLRGLGLLANGETLCRVIDRGGWEDLQHLVARVDVEVRVGAELSTRSLLATALVPAPPVTPSDVSRLVRERVGFLRLLDIQCSVLDARNGVVYERLISRGLREFCESVEVQEKQQVVREAARLAAIIDSGGFDRANVKVPAGEFGDVEDVLEFVGGISQDFPRPRVADALRVDGNHVVWVKWDRNLASYGASREHENLYSVLEACGADAEQLAMSEYLDWIRRCANESWVEQQLLGRRGSVDPD
ncbi:MAG: hypothetical protein U0556_00160 [Dehalococcoidia bacterium]